MTSFFSLFSLTHIRGEFIRTIQRFPISALLILIATGVTSSLIFLGYEIDPYLSTLLTRILITTIVTFLLSTALALDLEGRYPNTIIQSLVVIVSSIFWALFFLTIGTDPFESLETTTLIFVTFFGFSAFLFFAPFASRFWRAKYSEKNYVAYFVEIATILLSSLIVGGAIMALGSIALWSIDTLLISVDGDAYGYLASFAFAFFAPFFALARIPTLSDQGVDGGRIGIFFTFLVKYIGLPAIAIYFVILYLYTAKVLVNFSDWPRGEVSWMVIGFSTFGYLLYIFSHSIGEPDGLIQRVRRYFPFVVIPQIGMLAYAIYLRIAQYDLTMNRYFVIVFGLWLFGISLYYAFAKSSRLVYITVSLALTTLVISIGPWSVYQYPLARQYDRLIQNLETAGIYSGGTITPLQSYESIDPILSNEIARGIEYVCGFDNCDQIKMLFAKELETAISEKQSRWTLSESKYQKCMVIDSTKGGCYRDEYSEELTRWEIQNHLYEVLKVRVSNRYGQSYIPEFIHFSLDQKLRSHFPVKISDYTDLINVSNLSPINFPEKIHLLISPRTAEGILREGGQDIETFSLKEFLNTLIRNTSSDTTYDSGYRTIDPRLLEYSYTGKSYDIRIFLDSISLPNPAYSGATSQYGGDSVSGYALIRKK